MNGLQLNPIKAEVILFSATRGSDGVDTVTSVFVSKAVIQPESCLTALESPLTFQSWVTLDRNPSFDQHVNNTCKSCYHHFQALQHTRESLPDEVVKSIACSVIGSHLDNCNALLTGTSKSNFNKLQRVQNTLVHVVLRQRKYEHITPALKELHWLTVQYSFRFKAASLVYLTKTMVNLPTFVISCRTTNHFALFDRHQKA